jgi:ADP-heptose:LPS heptosyltransferase
MLCAIPALRALRNGLPEAEIVLAGLPSTAWLIDRFSAYFDGFRAFPGFPGLPEQPLCVDRTLAFFRDIRAERFDLAIQMHGSGEISNSAVLLCGAGRAAGFYPPGAYCPDADWFMPYPDYGREVHRLLSLVSYLGIRLARDCLEFPLRRSDREELRLLTGSELQTGAYVCIHPGASVTERRWPAREFAVVAGALKDLGFRVVLTGTAAERELTQSIADHVSGCIDLAGRTEIGPLAALLADARLLVCNDTGVSHLAAALRTPSVVISTGNNPERWAPIDQSRHRVLSAESVDAVLVIAEAESFLQAIQPNAACPEEPVCGPFAC